MNINELILKYKDNTYKGGNATSLGCVYGCD